MNALDPLVVAVVGFLAWLAGTVIYGALGGSLVEGSVLTYALNTSAAAVAFALVFRWIVAARRIDFRYWPLAAFAFVVPGMAIGAMMLGKLGVMFAGEDPEMLGRYAALAAFVYLSLPLAALPPRADYLPVSTSQPGS